VPRLLRLHPKNGTHNRFFDGVDGLLATLTRVFGEMQSHPELIRSYLTPLLTVMSLDLSADVIDALVDGQSGSHFLLAEVQSSI
jgi:hypothetical protein